jgi:Protein of unknown function (DUF2948)
MSSDLIKFVALDAEDLEIVSAHLQDAIAKAGDIIWLPHEKRIVIPVARFDWEAAVAAPPAFRRRQAALRFERVLSCKSKAIDHHSQEQVLNLLAIEFAQGDAPAGAVMLTFSGGAALRLEVECLEVELADLGPAWTCATCPDHHLDSDGAPIIRQA